MNLEEAIAIIKNNEVRLNRYATLNGKHIDIQLLKEIHDTLKDNSSLLSGIELKFKYRTSRRRALIVILEEEFYNLREYPDGIALDIFEEKSKLRFDISNRLVQGFDTPTKVHPKNPCAYYEMINSNKQKNQYQKALSEIILTPFVYFEEDKAEKHLREVYEDVKHC